MTRNRKLWAIGVLFLAGFALAQGNTVNMDFSPRGLVAGFYSGRAGLASSTHRVTNMLAGSITHDFASSTITCLDSSAITVTGAAVGDPCIVGPPAAPIANSSYSCYVSAADTVLVRFCPAGTAANPANVEYKVRVISNQ